MTFGTTKIAYTLEWKKNQRQKHIVLRFSSCSMQCVYSDFRAYVDSKSLNQTADQGLHRISGYFKIQLTLVISTPLISILSLMSNWFLSPDYFPYVFIVFQLRVCRTTFMSTLRLSRPSFSVPEDIFHSFYYRVSRTRTMTKEKNVRCGAAGLSVNESHNRPLINKSIF